MPIALMRYPIRSSDEESIMNEKPSESIREQIEALRSRQEHHERLARKHREAALRFWRKRTVLEFSAGEESREDPTG